ncbi:putative reverse transcriptase domain-containing protein [Tanacetum coccineum]
MGGELILFVQGDLSSTIGELLKNWRRVNPQAEEVFLQDRKLGFQDLLLSFIDLVFWGIDLVISLRVLHSFTPWTRSPPALFGGVQISTKPSSIPVEVSVAPEVGAAAVASPAEVLKLDTHSSSESDTEIPKRHVSPTPHDAMLTRWRSRIASRSSSPTTSTPKIPTAPSLPAPFAIVTPSSEFPLAPVDAPPGIRSRLDLYRTHPGGPCRALRYSSQHLDYFTSGSSSSHSSSDHSSSGHSISGHSLSRHTPPDTTDADTSTPPIFVYPSLARTPRCSEAYLRWRSAPLSTMYPPTTSESSTGDSSSESSAGPSRKICRSPDAIVISSIHAMRAIVPSRADLLPPRKRYRDSISPKDSVEEDIDTDVLEDIKVDATAIEVAVDRDAEAGVDAVIDMEVDIRVDVEDEVESSDRGTIEVGVDVAAAIDILDGMLMPDAVEHLEQVEEGLQDIYDHEALAAYEVTRAANALEAESQSQHGSDDDKGNGGNRNGGDGNGGNENGGNGNPNENNRYDRPVVRECTYQDFMKCQPLNFKGTEGVVGLIRWFEKIRTIGTEATFSMSWRELMKLMAEVYCPRNEIQKMEFELWNPTVKNNDLAAFTQRFQEWTMMCTKMVPEKEDQVEKFIEGLPDNI